jgi:nitroimidazol reductase NimA-like FMN-containing flavoprotein (pyridoxamine 5'-phosphate oxidase superfamily)
MRRRGAQGANCDLNTWAVRPHGAKETRMELEELTEAQCHDVLRRARVGRLGCTKDNQPYVIPVHFAFDAGPVYGFASVGQKIEWMRANPRVCLEVDEISDFNDWTSVVVFGQYQELATGPEWEQERHTAALLLNARGKWLESGYTATRLRGRHAAMPFILYRISIDQMTGRRARPGSHAIS